MRWIGAVAVVIVLGACARESVVASAKVPSPEVPPAIDEPPPVEEPAPVTVADEPCPAELTAILGVLEGIEFVDERWQIRTSSHARLDEIAQVLLRHPEYDIEIAGHVASDSELYMRQRPSQRRAEAVRDYLIHRGVDPQRLRPVGYGQEVPIDDPRTTEGRARNERIELASDDCSESPS